MQGLGAGALGILNIFAHELDELVAVSAAQDGVRFEYPHSNLANAMNSTCASPNLTAQFLLTVLPVICNTVERATNIGMNFVPSISGHTLPSGTSAGVEPQMNWQNITNFLLGPAWYMSTAFIGDEWLMDTNLAGSGTMSFTVTTIRCANYDLLIYDLQMFSSVLYT